MCHLTSEKYSCFLFTLIEEVNCKVMLYNPFGKLTGVLVIVIVTYRKKIQKEREMALFSTKFMGIYAPVQIKTKKLRIHPRNIDLV